LTLELSQWLEQLALALRWVPTPYYLQLESQ